jgi:hypothetical protein
MRASAVVLADVVREARRELLLMTYSAQPYQPLSGKSCRSALSWRVDAYAYRTWAS